MVRRGRELDLTVKDVCQRVGVTREAWYRLSRGETSSPSLRLLCKLADVYRVAPIRLIRMAYQDCGHLSSNQHRHVTLADAQPLHLHPANFASGAPVMPGEAI